MFRLQKHRAITSISNVDDDTLSEILIRLPIKHMVSCKLVSKLWFKLISSLCIPRIQTSNLYGQWNFACLNDTPNLSLIDSCIASNYPFSPSLPEDFIDCCNGFLLFFDAYLMRYCIFNPSTQQHVSFTTSSSNKEEAQFAALIYDKRYEVVYISHSGFMNIFSFTYGKWEVHKIVLDSIVASSGWSPRSVFFQGSVYRLSLSGHLLKFDVRDISCRAIELPEVVVRAAPIGCLGVSQGSICYSWSDHCSFVRVWTFEDEWNLKRTICFKQFDQHPICCDHDVFSQSCVCAFHPTSNTLFVGNSAGIFSYDPNTKRLESICNVTKDKMIHSGEYLVYPFSVNLTPIETYKWSAARSTGECQICYFLTFI
ncbi:hypothetical protein ACHQM5_018838 [Ranunculus cassubicifolius]